MLRINSERAAIAALGGYLGPIHAEAQDETDLAKIFAQYHSETKNLAKDVSSMKTYMEDIGKADGTPGNRRR